MHEPHNRTEPTTSYASARPGCENGESVRLCDVTSTNCMRRSWNIWNWKTKQQNHTTEALPPPGIHVSADCTVSCSTLKLEVFFHAERSKQRLPALSAHSLLQSFFTTKTSNSPVSKFLLLFFSLRNCWHERRRDPLLHNGLDRGRVDDITSWCQRNGSNYCQTDRDANWVIKDFNLKGCEKVILAVWNDRRVYLQQKTYIVLVQKAVWKNTLCDVYQLNTDSFSAKGFFCFLFFPLPTGAVSEHQLLFSAFLSWFKNLKSVSGHVRIKTFEILCRFLQSGLMRRLLVEGRDAAVYTPPWVSGVWMMASFKVAGCAVGLDEMP